MTTEAEAAVMPVIPDPATWARARYKTEGSFRTASAVSTRSFPSWSTWLARPARTDGERPARPARSHPRRTRSWRRYWLLALAKNSCSFARARSPSERSARRATHALMHRSISPESIAASSSTRPRTTRGPNGRRAPWAMRKGMSADCEMARAGSRATMAQRISNAALAGAVAPTVAFAMWMIGDPNEPVSGPKSHGIATSASMVAPKPGPHFVDSIESVASIESVVSIESIESVVSMETAESAESVGSEHIWHWASEVQFARWESAHARTTALTMDSKLVP